MIILTVIAFLCLLAFAGEAAKRPVSRRQIALDSADWFQRDPDGWIEAHKPEVNIFTRLEAYLKSLDRSRKYND